MASNRKAFAVGQGPQKRFYTCPSTYFNGYPNFFSTSSGNFLDIDPITVKVFLESE
jgi:hypothetical protein